MRRGDTVVFGDAPAVTAWAAAGGKKESEGPLAGGFDTLFTDTRLGEETWEMAERGLARSALETALRKAHTGAGALDGVFAGDLQCQCTASAYLMRGVDAPFLGLYGACSTMTEALGLAACLVSAGHMRLAAACASSHFCAAERQYRTPLNYGGKRTPTAQWTVTGAGAMLVAPGKSAPKAPRIAAVTFGRVRDFAVRDITNMGAAMAPAACETLLRYFADTGEDPAAIDCVFTGDLGAVGSELLGQLLAREGLCLGPRADCGLLVYDRAEQDVQAGGSGAGCSACVLAAHILPRLAAGRLRRCLVVATGALMSQTTFLQGESIPGIAHLIELRAGAAQKEAFA